MSIVRLSYTAEFTVAVVRVGKHAAQKNETEVVEAGRIELPSVETYDREHSCFSTFIFVS